MKKTAKTKSPTAKKRIIKRYSVDGSKETFSFTQLVKVNDKESLSKEDKDYMKTMRLGATLFIGNSILKRVK